ncbi:helix-turn-helix domain-containing protein [Actinoplanes sp. NPDC051343]|uniref:helix-turn-helix domain-containing protein n=1 Tax=Actinoplanes sp. NPDC051343 TaxID=3363906 RepID=UPI0037B77796
MVDIDPVVGRRHLRLRLKQLRLDKGDSLLQVATVLDWSHSKLVRIEQGKVGISQTDLRALLAYYGVTDPEEIKTAVEQARASSSRRQPYSKYASVLNEESRNFFLLQERSISFMQFDPLLIPGLFQTPEYAGEVVRALRAQDELADDPEITQIVEARIERQERLLERADGPIMSVILDESALRRWVGSSPGKNDIMIGQLERLKELTGHPQVHMQIAPFRAGIYAGIRDPFVVLELPGASPGQTESALYLETRGDLVLREENDEVVERTSYFYGLQKLSLPESETDRFIDGVIEDLRAVD